MKKSLENKKERLRIHLLSPLISIPQASAGVFPLDQMWCLTNSKNIRIQVQTIV